MAHYRKPGVVGAEVVLLALVLGGQVAAVISGRRAGTVTRLRATKPLRDLVAWDHPDHQAGAADWDDVEAIVYPCLDPNARRVWDVLFGRRG